MEISRLLKPKDEETSPSANVAPPTAPSARVPPTVAPSATTHAPPLAPDVAVRRKRQSGLQPVLESRIEWDENRMNKLARVYERFKADMWSKIAQEVSVPWRAAEAMHWQMGEQEMAYRAAQPEDRPQQAIHGQTWQYSSHSSPHQVTE